MVLDRFPEKEKELRREMRNAVEETFPEQAAEVAKSFGLKPYSEQHPVSQPHNPAAPSLILIHGLDDPGKVWMNLAPALIERDIDVWQMKYPNDQPIVDSAGFFHAEIRRLMQFGIGEVIIVAHSMGGLVSREMLTNPQIAYLEETRAGKAPQVVGLVMVGTPNHGSEFARFRTLGEVREQFTHWLGGRGHILGGILDGAGEAKIDLLPGSQFLRRLNNRPHPEGVRMLSIAGILSPWDEADTDRWVDAARETTPVPEQTVPASLEAFLASMSDGLGDGLVTVESTRLDGIDHRKVRGTHLSMIRNVSAGSSRIPPAIPLIISYVAEMASARSMDPALE